MGTKCRMWQALPILVLVSSIGCGSMRGVSQAPSDPTIDGTPVFPAPDQQASGEYPIYRDPPIRLTSGRYQIPVSTQDYRVEGVSAQAADAGKQRFSGWIQGIYVAQYPDPERAPRYPCPKSDVRAYGQPKDEEFLRSSPYWFEPPSYLPPGTFDWTYAAGAGCGSDAPFGVSREFIIDGGPDLVISRSATLYFRGVFSVDRVMSGTIGGLPAVMVPPYTTAGFGDSHIVVRESSGATIQITATDLTFTELQRIAESMITDIS